VTVIVNPVEPLSADPVLHVAPSDPGFSAAKKEGESYVFTYDVNESAAEGTAYSFSVDLVDLAGNETKGAPIDGTVTVDRTPPVVSGGAVDKTHVGVGGTVTVTFSVDEELSEEPVVTIGDRTMSPVVGDSSPAIRGPWSVVRGRPASGRRGATLRSDSGQAQAAPPAAPSAPVDLMAPGGGQAQGSHGREPVDSPGGATHAFGAREHGAAPTALGAHFESPIHGFSPVATSVPPPAGGYSFLYTTTGEETEGSFLITVQIVDLARNRRSESLADRVTFDFSAPKIVSSVASPALAALGGEVVYQVTIDEPLAEGSAPKLVTSPSALTWTDAEVEGSSYRWRHTAAAGESGDYTVSIDKLCDDLANCAENVTAGATGDLSEVRIDADAPRQAFEILPAPDARVKTGAQVKLNVNVEDNDRLASGYPRARIGGKEMPLARARDRGWAYTFAYTTDETKDSEGAQTVVLDVADEAGNAGTVAVGSVTFDFMPPVLSISATPSSRPARLGEVLTVAVTSNEALDAAGVTLDKGGMVLGDPSVSGTSYTWTFAVKDTDTGSFNLTANAQDLAGNPAAPVSKMVSVDGVVPKVVTGPTLNKDPASYKAGDAVSVTFVTNEDLDANLPTATLGTNPVKEMPCVAQGAKSYMCDVPGVLFGTETPQGQVGISITLKDAAGNTGFASTIAVLDFTPPDILSTNVSPESAKVGTTVYYTVTPNEILQGPPSLSVGGAGSLGFTLEPATTYIFKYTVVGGELSGIYQVGVTMIDLAGNSATIAADRTKEFKLDSDIPQISNVVTDRELYSRATGFDVVTLTFESSEDLLSGLIVRINHRPMNCGAYRTQSPNYTCTHPIDLLDVEGIQNILVSATNAMGNTYNGNSSVVFDFTLPSVAESGATPDPAGLGKTLRYTVNVSEPLSGNPGRPAIKVLKGGVEQSGFFGDPATETNTSFTYVKPVAPGLDGTYTVKIDLTDEAGNTAPGLNGAGFEIDATAPVFTAHDVSPERVKSGQDVTVTFTTSEDLVDDPIVQLGLLVMTKAAQTGRDYTYKYTTLGTEGDGTRTVSMQMADVAGNAGGAVFSETIVFDFTAPFVVGGSASVQFFPDFPAANPLPYVTAATNNTKVRTTFTMSEPVSPNPKVIMYKTAAFEEAESIELTLQVQAGTLYTYEGTVTGVATGLEFTDKIHIPLPPFITDAAGNSPAAALDVTTFPLDTNVPAAPDVTTADRIIYKRVPWGSDATAGAKTFTLRGEVNALPADATNVVVYDSDTPSPGGRIGSKTKRPDNGFDEFPLNGSDRANIYAASTDVAGNLSALNLVKDAEWTATMGYKVVGSTFENPHRYEARPWLVGSLEQEGTAEAGAGDGLGMIGVPALELRGLGAWWHRALDNPAARRNHAMAYDGARGKVVLFGGSTGTYDGETWEWDGTSWVKKIPADPEADGNPSARDGHAMAYDIARGKVVLFGGSTGTYDGETWEWDGTSWAEKIPKDPEGDGNPSARQNHAMAFDIARGRIVLFGGLAGSFSDETWEWDGTSWAKKIPADLEADGNPSARCGHAMAYDIARERVVLFGGSAGGSPNEQTWEWDGSGWVKKTPADPEGDGNPSARFMHAMAYDSSRGKVVLFGGSTGGSYNDETWGWDGTSWVKKIPADPEADGNPSARNGHAMVYNIAREKVVLFGGSTGSIVGETWEWGGTSWAKKTPVDPVGDRNPSARYWHAMTFDSTRMKTVLFGGCSDYVFNCADMKDDIWEWDGMSWLKITPTDPEGDGDPSARFSHAMAYDGARGKTVLFGGCSTVSSGSCASCLDDTWEWDGTSWAKKTLVDPEGDGNPSARFMHAMAYDSSRGKVVLFGGSTGGSYNDETWEWDGTSWARKTPTDPEEDWNPSARYGHAMAYDSARGKTVMFGGYRGMYDGGTWEWDGTSWTRKLPADPEGDGNPSARYGHAMAWDSAREKTVMFGGWNGSFDGELWEWDGTSWAKKTPTDPEEDWNPSARYGHAMAYDSARGKTVVFGGNTVGPNSETWEWDFGANARAGQVISTSFGVAGVSTIPTWKSLTGTFYSGGVGYPSGVATNGVDLKVWDEGMWKTVASNDSGPEGPSHISWSTDTDPYWSNLKATDPAAFQNNIRRLFFGDQQTLNFAVTPVAPNGTGTGEISVDYAEVTVKYRMP